MSSAAVAAIKAAILALTDENTRKKIGWVLVAILSPIILIVALICSIFSSTSQQNVSTVELCFHGGTISSEVTPEYRQYVLEMRESFGTLDSVVEEINDLLEEGNSLDANRVKAIFYVLYFGGQQPDEVGLQSFVDCFVTYTEGTRTVIDTDEEGNEVEVEETYQIPHLVDDLAQVYERIGSTMGIGITGNHQANAYLPPALVSALNATLHSMEDRICRLLFKLAVEMDMMMSVLASGMEIPAEQLERLRPQCVRNVKKTSGSISLDSAVERQER